MQEILSYVRSYWNNTDKIYLGIVSLLTAILVFLNYFLGIDDFLSQLPGLFRWAGYTLVYLVSFGIPYLLYYSRHQHEKAAGQKMLLLVLLMAAIFAFKVSSASILNTLHRIFQDRNADYWAPTLNIPIKLAMVSGSLYFVREKLLPPRARPVTKGPDLRLTYGLLLLLMVPLIATAATQESFQTVYPKYRSVPIPERGPERILYILIYELSYALDFITIEVFFRGMLVIGFARIAGPSVVIPMACFYCSIHFGKPAAECVSSYFGGLALGILSLRTQSISGGLFIHIGIALLMEIAGSIAFAVG